MSNWGIKSLSGQMRSSESDSRFGDGFSDTRLKTVQTVLQEIQNCGENKKS